MPRCQHYRLYSILSWHYPAQAGFLHASIIESYLLQAVKALANHMKQGSLKAGEILEIFLPAQDSCVWLNQDVVLIDRYVHTLHACTSYNDPVIQKKSFTHAHKEKSYNI